ncbi:MAG: hypothetical protein GX541_04400 [Clostridiales bacterium]|jgi:hypothetical protein|nr:hypothetical protein [Clostridiales bacterium]
MKRLWVFGILPLVLGAVGAYLRAYEMVFVIDEAVELPQNSGIVTNTLGGLSLALAVFFLAYALKARKRPAEPEAAHKSCECVPTAAVLSSAILFTYGAYKLYICTAEFEISMLIFGFLTIYGAASILIIGLMQLENRDNALYAVFASVPVFWACYSLILLFRERISDPIILDYIYVLFAYISILLFTYTLTGFVFGKDRIVIATLSGGMCVYLCAIELLSPVFVPVFNPEKQIGLLAYSEKLPLLAFIIFVPFALNKMYRNISQIKNKQ